ncbi:hypothetical protein ACFH04_11860 [Streptomyces noboritoensis]|uniref:Uncharacterized protein n=1 Tax=Streptomyces noboritoensis TaxID=67337 RepID=A0ABV6TF35_9ACTN
MCERGSKLFSGNGPGLGEVEERALDQALGASCGGGGSGEHGSGTDSQSQGQQCSAVHIVPFKSYVVLGQAQDTT